MVRSEVDDFLEENFRKPSKAHGLYEMAISKTMIEKLHEEDEVLRRMLRGETQGSILKYLKEKYLRVRKHKKLQKRYTIK